MVDETVILGDIRMKQQGNLPWQHQAATRVTQLQYQTSVIQQHQRLSIKKKKESHFITPEHNFAKARVHLAAACFDQATSGL